jgi:hypothetical protein
MVKKGTNYFGASAIFPVILYILAHLVSFHLTDEETKLGDSNLPEFKENKM